MAQVLVCQPLDPSLPSPASTYPCPDGQGLAVVSATLTTATTSTPTSFTADDYLAVSQAWSFGFGLVLSLAYFAHLLGSARRAFR